MAFSTLIEAAQLAAHLDDADWVIFDCRFDLGDTTKGRRDYDAGHIPGARYAHLDEDLAGPIVPGSGRHPLPDAEAFIAWLRRQGVSNDSQVVVYDEGAGAFASRLWWMLRHWLGHEATALLHGGLDAWQSSGLPTDTQPARPLPGDLSALPDDSRLIDSNSLADALQAGDTCLIDARMPPRFKGEMEPLDPVAGHIPGAVNLPFAVNLVEGRFNDPEELRQRYLAAMEGKDPAHTVCMCGSGVTACHDLLAMEIAGLPGGRLFVGSWSAWCSDPGRPVAREV
jgi:thiosulfate/3-mercaptopyruvate sulfurtransferase